MDNTEKIHETLNSCPESEGSWLTWVLKDVWGPRHTRLYILHLHVAKIITSICMAPIPTLTEFLSGSWNDNQDILIKSNQIDWFIDTYKFNLNRPSFFTSFFFFSKRNRISVAFKVTIPIFPDLPDLLGGWSEAGGNSLATLWKAGGAKLARKILFAFSRSLHHLSSNLLIWFSTAMSIIKLT